MLNRDESFEKVEEKIVVTSEDIVKKYMKLFLSISIMEEIIVQQ